MSEFTDELKKLDLAINLPSKTYFAIEEKFKDWQPPKPLVIVPQFVADFIKAMIAKDLKPLMNSSKFGELGFTEEKLQEILYWVKEHQEEYIRAWIDGYTVEKEQMFILKHIDISKLSTDDSLYLAHGMNKKLRHVTLSKDVDVHNIDQLHFTKSEVDELNVSSYEQIEVDK